MKKSGLCKTAVTFMAAAFMFVTPVTAWADETTSESVALINIDSSAETVVKNAVEEAIETVIDDVMEDAEIADNAARSNLVNYALQFVGGKYCDGGNDPHTGVDCSGFIKYVMKHGAGINIARSSRAQSTQGKEISVEEMQPGDLIFYAKDSSINHVAMYIGNGKVVHASTYKTGIKLSDWNYRVPVKIVNMIG